MSDSKRRDLRRWRFWACFLAPEGFVRAKGEIDKLKAKGFEAKIWAPLPKHKTSGHIHIVVLSTLTELLRLAGVEK